MRTAILLVAVAGAYALLRGWDGAPGMLLRSCLAVATLVTGLAFWGMGKRDTVPRMFCLRRATWLDYLSLGAAIIFAEACFVVFTSTLAAPAQELADAFHGKVTEPAQTESGPDGGGGDPSFNGHTSGNWLFNRSLERNLPPNSNHKPSNRPEVFVELETRADATRVLNARLYLRAFAMARFNGVTWSAIPAEGSGGNTLLKAPVTFPRNNHGRVRTEPVKHTIYHAANPTGQNVFTAFQGAVSSDVPELTRAGSAIHLLPTPADPTSGYSYTVTSRPVNFTNLIGEDPGVAAAGPAYLSLPDNLAPQIRETARLFEHRTGLTSQLTALRLWLQENYTYSLETTNAGGANPVENFLYREKRGYCEHFATAAALVCRALGVPSRIAYGWAGGRLYPAQNMFVYRAKDAHAWTEIKLDGYGWVVFDTTPPDNGAVPEPHSAPEGETPPDPVQATTAHAPGLEEDGTAPLAALETDFKPSRLAAALAVLGGCWLAFLAARHLRRQPTDNCGRPLTAPAPGYLLLFKRACASLGVPMPTGRTLRQHVDALHADGKAPAFAPDLLDYHYGLLYGGLPRSAAREKSLTRSIRRWTRGQAGG